MPARLPFLASTIQSQTGLPLALRLPEYPGAPPANRPDFYGTAFHMTQISRYGNKPSRPLQHMHIPFPLASESSQSCRQSPASQADARLPA